MGMVVGREPRAGVCTLCFGLRGDRGGGGGGEGVLGGTGLGWPGGGDEGDGFGGGTRGGVGVGIAGGHVDDDMGLVTGTLKGDVRTVGYR